MTNYEKIRADVSKHFKSEIENLKLEVIRLNKENANLQVENAVLKNDIRKYKKQLESISDSKKALFCMTDTVMHII